MSDDKKLFELSFLLLLLFMTCLFFSQLSIYLGIKVPVPPSRPIYPAGLPHGITGTQLSILALIIGVISLTLGNVYKKYRAATFLNFIDLGISLFTIVVGGSLI